MNGTMKTLERVLPLVAGITVTLIGGCGFAQTQNSGSPAKPGEAFRRMRESITAADASATAVDSRRSTSIANSTGSSWADSVDPIGTRHKLDLGPLTVAGIKRTRWSSVPKSRQKMAARALIAIPLEVKTKVGPLRLDKTELNPGDSLSVLAGGLKSKTNAMVTVVGPDFSAQRESEVRKGMAGGTIHLPDTLAPGNYYVGVVDLTHAEPPNGFALLAAAAMLVK